MLFYILWLLLFGFVVGAITKFFVHTGTVPIGFLPTCALGIAGSFVGGAINYIIGNGRTFIEPSGLLMSILGAVIVCIIYSKWHS